MTPADSPLKNPIVVGVLAWFVPGAGHWLLGWRGHGILFGVVIVGLFWMGMFVGGVHSTIDPHSQMAWFLAQLCAGFNALLAMMVDRVGHGEESIAKVQDMGVVYSGVSGLLNVLVVLDAAARAERPPPGAESPAEQRDEEDKR